jgi:hypothetical protein
MAEGVSDATAQCNSVDRHLCWDAWPFLCLTAIERNTQEEYINEARALDYAYAVQTFIAGFLASAIATAAVLSIVLVLVGWLFRRT